MRSRIHVLVAIVAAVLAVVGLSSPASAGPGNREWMVQASVDGPGSRDNTPGVRDNAPGVRDNGPGNREWTPGARDDAPFAAQARSLGLTAAQARGLQSQVQAEVARTGGTQVAVNEVRFDGGATVFPLPGESTARVLTAPAHQASTNSAAAASHPTMYRCPYLYFCTYTRPGFRGSMHMLIKCGFYYEVNYDVYSYVNNQTKGTAARFYDAYKHYFVSSGDAYKDVDYMDLSPRIRSILPCSP